MSLCVKRSITHQYLLGEYSTKQGNLNLRHPIYVSYVSRDYIFTMAGVTSEGLEEVSSIIRLISLVYYSREIIWALSGSERVMEASC